MKKEYQYLIAGAVVSAAVLLGMGVVGEEKQDTEGRFQFLPYSSIHILNFASGEATPAFGVMDTQTGTVNAASRQNETLVFPFAATQTE